MEALAAGDISASPTHFAWNVSKACISECLVAQKHTGHGRCNYLGGTESIDDMVSLAHCVYPI